MDSRKRNQGFSLIEMMVVIVIMGILSTAVAIGVVEYIHDDIVSYGADGEPGGDGKSKDIGSWVVE